MVGDIWAIGGGKVINRVYRLFLRTFLEKEKKMGQYISMKIADIISFIIVKVEYVLSDSDLLKEFMNQDLKVSFCLWFAILHC